MKKILLMISSAVLACAIFVYPTAAQSDEELKLSMSRDFGYSSGTGDIQGTFSMKVSGPDTLIRVDFYIDEVLIATDEESPFRVQFSTDNYSLGLHTLYAVGYLVDGSKLVTREVHANFVTADEGWQAALKIMIPVFALVLLAALASSIIPALSRRGKKNQLSPPGGRSYGVVGGTICPRCNHPFGMSLFSPNILVGKLVRCEQCGKWFIGRRATLEALRVAEEAEWTQVDKSTQPTNPADEDELKTKVDESKFID